jgi:hypothetical protein
MLSEADLLAAIDKHLAETGEYPSKFGLRVVGDPNLIRQLRKGRSPTLRVAAQIMAALKTTEAA